MKHILLTFDLEEFDLSLEFGQSISQKQMFEISKKGLESLLVLLSKHELQATFFTTANFAKHNEELIKIISKEGHEIASHGYDHSDSYTEDISKIELAKQEIEKIIGKKIHGFRAPRFEIKNISGLSRFGFSYDSSLHPTFIPGRYINLNKKRTVHKIGDITEIPLSTLPLFRLPIFWLAFKNLPITYAKIFAKINSLFSDYTMLYFHPWEFSRIRQFNLPRYINNIDGLELLRKLEKYIVFCKKQGYNFIKVRDFLNLE